MIELVKRIEEANCITHSGTFHADDIFATVFLEKRKGSLKVYRAMEFSSEEKIRAEFIYDIGRGKYDHHGETARVRENGIKYSSFGLLFEEFGKAYLEEKGVLDVSLAYEFFLKEFVMQIDAIDNGVFPENPHGYTITTLSEMIGLLNPTWEETQTSDEAFLKAIDIGRLLFDRMESHILGKVRARAIVEQAIQESENSLLILPMYVPFMDALLMSQNPKAKGVLFAVLPSNRGGYSIRAIIEQQGSYKNRLNFPEKWGGKSAEELQQMTGIQTFRFCHKNLFCASCDTLDDAIQVANLAIKKE